jgi:iron-sulfur cluster repair protein YtfE (RIC family)
MTIHELFIADHARLRHQITTLQNTTASLADLEQSYAGFQKDLRAHFHKEDSVYYAYVDAEKKIPDRELFHTLRNDHAAVIFALESLAIRLRKKVPLPEWKSKFHTMIQVLLPHFDQEEQKLFPEVERLFTPAELEALHEKVRSLT